mgnify:CR=1 FL=1
MLCCLLLWLSAAKGQEGRRSVLRRSRVTSQNWFSAASQQIPETRVRKRQRVTEQRVNHFRRQLESQTNDEDLLLHYGQLGSDLKARLPYILMPYISFQRQGMTVLVQSEIRIIYSTDNCRKPLVSVLYVPNEDNYCNSVPWRRKR